MPTVTYSQTEHLPVSFERADATFLDFWAASFRASGWVRVAPGVYRDTAKIGWRRSVVLTDTVSFRAAPAGGTDVTYQRSYHSFVAGPVLQPLMKPAWRSLFHDWHRMFTRYLDAGDQRAVA